MSQRRIDSFDMYFFLCSVTEADGLITVGVIIAKINHNGAKNVSCSDIYLNFIVIREKLDVKVWDGSAKFKQR